MKNDGTLRHLFVKKKVQPVTSAARAIRQYDSPHVRPSSMGSIVGRLDMASYPTPQRVMYFLLMIFIQIMNPTIILYNTARYIAPRLISLSAVRAVSVSTG